MGLQAIDQFLSHAGSWGPDAAGCLGSVLEQTDGRFADHFGGAAVARVTVALHAHAAGLTGRVVADEQNVVRAGIALCTRGAFTWLQDIGTAHAFIRSNRFGHSLAFVARASDDHFVVDKVRPPSLIEQKVGAVHIAGVDGGHYKGGHPHLKHLIDHGFVRGRLLGAGKSRC